MNGNQVNGNTRSRVLKQNGVTETKMIFIVFFSIGAKDFKKFFLDLYLILHNKINFYGKLLQEFIFGRLCF